MLKYFIYALFSIVLGFLSYQIISLDQKQKNNAEIIASYQDAKKGVFNTDVLKQKAEVMACNFIDNYSLSSHSEQLSSWVKDNVPNIIAKMDLSRYRNYLNKEIIRPRYDDFMTDHDFIHSGIDFIDKNFFENYIELKKEDFNRLESEAKKVLVNELNSNISSLIFGGLNRYEGSIKSFIKKKISSKLNIDSAPIANHEATVHSLEIKNAHLLQQNNFYIRVFLAVSLIFLIISYFINRKKQDYLNHFFLIDLQILAFFLLIIGVFTSMLTINLFLPDFHFSILDGSLNFDNQVLYYQRKSIFDVAVLVWKHVPFLSVSLITFSVIFPSVKMLALSYSISFNKYQRNNILNVIISSISKFSMADVFIIALFLSYLGFNGIFSNMQFPVALDNQNKFEIGFFFFFAYVLLSLINSTYYSYIINHSKHISE